MDEEKAILSELFEHDILVSPEVVRYIMDKGGRRYLGEFIEKYGSYGYIDGSDIASEIKSPGSGAVQNHELRSSGVSKRPPAAEYDWDYKVIMDASMNMKATGGTEDFHRLFVNRYEKLYPILRSRGALRNARAIDRLENGAVAVIGMVNDLRRTNTGKLLFELEDPAGTITCFYSGSEVILNDEVIGVTGNYKKSRNTLYVKEVVFPEVGWVTKNRKIKEMISAAIISDTHVGSKTFLEKRWLKFIKWLKEGEGEAGIIKYLIIAGDLVDGIGVYPHQEDELEILDIFEQYQKLAEYLSELPDYIKVITIPGNHDMVRNAEPQPVLPKEIRDMFTNTEFLSNPAMVSLHGYKFLVYHGASLNNLVELIPGVDYQQTGKMMKYMLKVRHLSPVYGEKVPIVPLPEDYLVIDTVPDVLVTGHVHTFSYEIHKSIHLINASTWQEQTKYQKMMNFNPDPGKVAVIDFSRDEVFVKEF